MLLIAPRNSTTTEEPPFHTRSRQAADDAAPATPAPAVSSRAQPESHHLRVMLADDHRILREGLVTLLEDEWDLEVVGQASDGEMAVEMAERIQPDVVVMDVTMPRVNGIEATRQITTNLPHTRVVGLSMHNEADMAEALFDAGAAAYLTKGGPSDDLIDAIRGHHADK